MKMVKGVLTKEWLPATVPAVLLSLPVNFLFFRDDIFAEIIGLDSGTTELVIAGALPTAYMAILVLAGLISMYVSVKDKWLFFFRGLAVCFFINAFVGLGIYTQKFEIFAEKNAYAVSTQEQEAIRRALGHSS